MSRSTKKEAVKAKKGKQKIAKKESLLKQKRKNYGSDRQISMVSAVASSSNGLLKCESCGTRHSLNAAYMNEGRCGEVLDYSSWPVNKCNGRLRMLPLR